MRVMAGRREISIDNYLKGFVSAGGAGGRSHKSFAAGWRPLGMELCDRGASEATPGRSTRGQFYRILTPGYFAAMQLPLVRGRHFTEAGSATAPGVVIINEQAARQYWPGEDPIGKRVCFDDDTTNPSAWLTVIGIAKDAKQESWTDKASPEAYLAVFQNRDYLGDSGSEASNQMNYITLVARSAGDPGGHGFRDEEGHVVVRP